MDCSKLIGLEKIILNLITMQEGLRLSEANSSGKGQWLLLPVIKGKVEKLFPGWWRYNERIIAKGKHMRMYLLHKP
jgi:hypothetical protein